MNTFLKSSKTMLALGCLLLGMGLLVTWYVFFNLFYFPYIGTMLGMSLVFALLFVALFKAPLKRVVRRGILIALGVLWAVTGLLLKSYLAEGAVVFSGYIIPELHRIVKYVFPIPPVPTPADELACTVFCLYFLFPYSGLLAWSVVVRQSAIVSLLLTVPVFGFTYSLRGIPENLYLVLLFVFWITVILHSRPVRKSLQPHAGISLLSMALSGAVIAGLLALYPRDEYKRSPTTIAIRDDIINLAVNFEFSSPFRGLPGFTSGAPLTSTDGSVNLNSTGNLRFSEREVLRVHTDTPQSLYLRGYSASQYTGHEWLQDEEIPAVNNTIEIEPLAFLEDSFLNDYILWGPSRPVSSVTVEPDRATSRFLFTPYLFAGVEAADPSPEWVNGSYLAANGHESYTLSTYKQPLNKYVIAGIDETADVLYDEYSVSMYVEGETGTVEYGGSTLSFTKSTSVPWFTLDNTVSYDVILDAYMYFTDPPDALNTIDLFYPASLPDASYMQYITKEYTQLPDGLKESLLGWWNGLGSREYYGIEFSPSNGNVSYWSWVAAAHLVSEEIRNSGSYTTSPGAQPLNQDFVEYFLFESNKGYCVHFASATVAMLRALGVPARYVEGYVVGETAFGEDGWASVPAKSAHAWAEIWVPCLGWIPVDSTPGGTSVSQLVVAAPERPPADIDYSNDPRDPRNPDYNPGIDGIDRLPPGADGPNTPANPGGAGASGAGGGDTAYEMFLKGLFPGLLWAAAIIAALAVVLFVPRSLITKRRQRRFASENSKAAALYLYSHLEWMESYGSEPTEAAREIALKAKFSEHSVNDEELELLRAEINTSRAFLSVVMTRREKLWFWLLGA